MADLKLTSSRHQGTAFCRFLGDLVAVRVVCDFLQPSRHPDPLRQNSSHLLPLFAISKAMFVALTRVVHIQLGSRASLQYLTDEPFRRRVNMRIDKPKHQLYLTFVPPLTIDGLPVGLTAPSTSVCLPLSLQAFALMAEVRGVECVEIRDESAIQLFFVLLKAFSAIRLSNLTLHCQSGPLCLQGVSSELSSVESLSVHECSSFDLAQVATLLNLRKLCLVNVRLCSESCRSQPSFHERLGRIELISHRGSLSPHFTKFLMCPNVTELRIHGDEFAEPVSFWAISVAFPSLEALSIDTCNTEADLGPLRSLKRLRSLSIEAELFALSCSPSSEPALLTLPCGIEQLEIEFRRHADRALLRARFLPTLLHFKTSLRCLKLIDCPAFGGCFAFLHSLPELSTLHIHSRKPVRHAGLLFRAIRRLTKLEQLNLSLLGEADLLRLSSALPTTVLTVTVNGVEY